MKTAEIVTVGEELLTGNVADTNAAFLSRALREAGYQVRFRQTCGDMREDIVFSLKLALSRAHLVLVTGGLGPTYDDITRQVAAQVFDVPLLPHEETEKKIRAFFQRRGMEMCENNLLQSLVPQGATVLENDWGTAPGLWLRGEKGSAVLLPGVPSEMKMIFRERVLPVLLEEGGEHPCGVVLRFYGISESRLDEALSDLTDRFEGTVIAPYAGDGEVALHITSFADTKEKAEETCKIAKESILARVGAYCYGEGETTSLEEVLVRKALSLDMKIATAESCTGGLVSSRITSIPGSSAMFSLGLCTYSEEEKIKRLGVSKTLLSRFGVYSKECALAMAKGAIKRSGADLGIGITGIAGPDGGTERDPVGTVYIAVVTGEREVCERVVCAHAASGRNVIRRRASSKALSMALAALTCEKN